MRKQVAVSEKSMSALSILPGTFEMIRARCRVFQRSWSKRLLPQALALMRGRDYVSAEDVERLSAPIFQHRIAMATWGFELPGRATPSPPQALTRSTLTR